MLKQPRIVVLGAGYGGLTCFLELQDQLGGLAGLTLVNSDKYHWFTVQLHTFVAGEPEESVRVPLPRVLARRDSLVVGEVVRVDRNAHQVLLEDGRRIDYDLLVFALGSDPEYYGLPGVAEHALVVSTWQGATRARERVHRLVESAAPKPLPHVVVAGGGLTGVEVAGELADRFGGRLRLTIVEAGREIMTGFAEQLVKIAWEVLTAKGINVRTQNPIARVAANRIAFGDGREMSFDLLVWAGGVRGSHLLAEAGLAVTPKGRGRVDERLRSQTDPDLYIVGDSAAFVDPATGQELLPTAQAAVQMGRAAGINLLHRLQDRPETPFHPQIRGTFASLGQAEGIGQMGPEQFAGFPALLIKELVESHHAWETGGGILPLVSKLVRAPGRFLRTRKARRAIHHLPIRPAGAGS